MPVKINQAMRQPCQVCSENGDTSNPQDTNQKQKTMFDLPNATLQKVLGYLELRDLAQCAEVSTRMKELVRNVLNNMVSNADFVWSDGAFNEDVNPIQEYVNQNLESDMNPEQMVASLAEAISDDPNLDEDDHYVIKY